MLNSECNHRQRYVLAACLDVNTAWLKLFALSKLKKKTDAVETREPPWSCVCIQDCEARKRELCASRGVTHSSSTLPPQVPKCLSVDIMSHVERALGSQQRAVCMGKQTEEDTVNRTCIQNQYVGSAALVQPV